MFKKSVNAYLRYIESTPIFAPSNRREDVQETKLRTWVKALLWQVVGLVSMSLVGYWSTGSWQTGGTIALASAGLSLVIYVLYERLWTRIGWGLRA